MILRVLLFLLPVAAWAQPAAAPGPSPPALPPQQVIDKAVDMIRSDPQVLAAVIRSAAAQMIVQTNPQLAGSPAAPSATAAPASPPPSATAAVPSIAVVPAPQVISIPAEVRDAVLSLCSVLITAGIGAGLTWMRAHFAFMKEAGANAAITNSANSLGALLEQELAKHGASLSTVSVNDPTVAAFAQKLIASYPEWGPLVGLTPDIAARKVLGGAIEQSAVPLALAPPVAVVQPAPLAIVEAAATPQQPPPA